MGDGKRYYFNDLVNKAILKTGYENNLKPSFNHDIELTERELEVLEMICEEKTAPEIGKSDLFKSTIRGRDP